VNQLLNPDSGWFSVPVIVGSISFVGGLIWVGSGFADRQWGRHIRAWFARRTTRQPSLQDLMSKAHDLRKR